MELCVVFAEAAAVERKRQVHLIAGVGVLFKYFKADIN